MSEQSTTEPQQTGLDKVFESLRGVGIRRRSDDRWIGGVASGLADRLGVDPVIVRAAFVLLSILGGIGLTIYLLGWALLPDDRGQIAAERALVHGEAGPIVLLVFTAFALFGGVWWHDSGWAFPWGLALAGFLIWWLVQRSHNNPDADQRVRAQQSGTPYAAGPPTTPYAAGQPTTPYAPGPPTAPYAAGPPTTPYAAGQPTTRYAAGPPPPVARPAAPVKPRRRSGGPLMALLAIGLALVTYGSLSWLGTEYSWTGDHQVIAMAGSLATVGLLLVVLGFAGWRSGFVAFLAVVLAITAFSSSVAPKGIQVGGKVGDATWAPTAVSPNPNYHLGAGDGVLDLTNLPVEGLSEAKVPAYVGLGELRVIVPQDLTVEVRGHVGLGEIRLPRDIPNNEQGGTDVARKVVIGDGPTEVVVDAGVGVGQLTVVKE